MCLAKVLVDFEVDAGAVFIKGVYIGRMFMAMLNVGIEKDEYGKNQEVYLDTDDLNQVELYYYHKAIKMGKGALAMKILRGNVKAVDIENDSKYAYLLD